MRILVCGGRNFSDRKLMCKTLDQIYISNDFTHLIHGNANGADKMSEWWAEAYDIKIEVYPAQWDKHGRAAGPIRNKQMLVEGKPDLVVAFPGGRGTANMIKQAKAAGVGVIEFRKENVNEL